MAHQYEKNGQPFTFRDPDDFARMRNLLKTEGFMDHDVLETIGISNLPAIDGNDHPLLLERTGSGSPLHTLIRLFLMEAPVEAGILQNAIRPMTLDAWRQAGLITGNGADITATIKLLPFQGLVLAFDRSGLLETPLRPHYVMGIGGSTITLSHLTIRKQARRALDLGTGCGVHALLAAAHSDQVTATDLNPRAVRLARFNARLNGVANVECLEGDFFEPVHDRRFDLVVTNPPFVISPETRFIYRDGGMTADGVCRRIVREAPRHLNAGGFCQILCNWGQEADRDWKVRLAEWFDETGCDAWVMRSESLGAADYASKWIRHTEFHDRETPFAERFRQWMAYYEKLGIESIGMGLITLRKTESGANWFRADESPDKMQGPCGDDVARGFVLMDFLQTAGEDEKLLETRLHYAPDLRLEQKYEPTPEGWKTTASVIHLADGLTYRGNADPLIANLIVHCDGRKPLKALLPDMARSLGTEPENIAPTLCQLIRKLIEQGFLLPK
jgi:hypothetical protein